MSQEKIESRRAFMKMLGKTAGTVAATAAFLAVSKTVEAAPSKETPTTGCGYGNCSGSCDNSCAGSHSCYGSSGRW